MPKSSSKTHPRQFHRPAFAPVFSGLQTPKNAETPPPPPQIRQKIEGRIRLTNSYSMSYKNFLFTYR